MRRLRRPGPFAILLLVEVLLAAGVTSLAVRLHDRQPSAALIEAPPKDQIASTAPIDEKAVAGYHDVPLLAPRAIPAGWRLQGAAVLRPEQTVEGCTQVELDYADPFDQEHGYLTIFEFPVECSKGPDPEQQPRPFRAGDHAGFLQGAAGDRSGEVTSGRTVVQFVTDLGPDDLARVLADLVPLDLRAVPAPLPGVGGGTSVF